MVVRLIQYKRVEDVHADALEEGFWAISDNANAPYLNRVAIVSAPVKGLNGEPIAEMFNEQVGKALQNVQLLAEQKGFRL